MTTRRMLDEIPDPLEVEFRHDEQTWLAQGTVEKTEKGWRVAYCAIWAYRDDEIPSRLVDGSAAHLNLLPLAEQALLRYVREVSQE